MYTHTSHQAPEWALLLEKCEWVRCGVITLTLSHCLYPFIPIDWRSMLHGSFFCHLIPTNICTSRATWTNPTPQRYLDFVFLPWSVFRGLSPSGREAITVRSRCLELGPLWHDWWIFLRLFDCFAAEEKTEDWGSTTAVSSRRQLLIIFS